MFPECLLYIRPVLDPRRKGRQKLWYSKILGNRINVRKAALENLTDCLYFNAFIHKVIDLGYQAKNMSN